MSFLKNKNIINSILFFSTFFIVGVIIFDDYGISIDEDNTRLNGFVALKYLHDFFNLGYNDFLKSIPDINEFNEKGIGYIFDLPTAAIEYFFEINDSREKYLTRHFVNFLFFFSGVIFFYLIILKKYNSIIIAIIGSLLLILSPRIFAESFYNNKDLIFLSLFIISTYWGIELLKKPSISNILIFSITSAMATGIRILGIMLPVVIIFFFTIYILRNLKKDKQDVKLLILLILTIPITILFFYPFLWDNPLENFLFIFNRLSNFEIDLYNFYLGNFIKAENVPWHYTIVWLFSTTPLVFTILFLIGFLHSLRRIFKRLLSIEEGSLNDLWRGNKEMQDLLFISLLLVPVFATIIINSTLYNGWRHMYFIYPFFLLISIQGFYLIHNILFKKKIIVFIILSIIIFTHPLIWIIKNHPHQYVYFNTFYKNKADKYFDLDHWGVSNYHSLKYIVDNSSGFVKISKISDSHLELSKQFLNKEIRSRIKIIDNILDSDYVIDGYIYWNGDKTKNKNLLKEFFTKIYDIKVDGVPISTIYKKN